VHAFYPFFIGYWVVLCQLALVGWRAPKAVIPLVVKAKAVAGGAYITTGGHSVLT